jgi:hypothetical protein
MSQIVRQALEPNEMRSSHFLATASMF